MSEEQERAVNTLIEQAGVAIKEARSAKKTYTELIRIFAVTILMAVSSITGAIWQGTHTARDLEYYRKHSLNSDAFFSDMEARELYMQGITALIEDEDHQKIVKEFNEEMKKLNEKILATETEIVPRGATIDNKRFQK